MYDVHIFLHALMIFCNPQDASSQNVQYAQSGALLVLKNLGGGSGSGVLI